MRRANKRGYTPSDDLELLQHWAGLLKKHSPHATPAESAPPPSATYFCTLQFARELAESVDAGAGGRTAEQILGKLKDFRRRYRVAREEGGGFGHMERVGEILELEEMVVRCGPFAMKGRGRKRGREGREGEELRELKGLEMKVRKGELEVRLAEVEVRKEEQRGRGVEDREWKMQMALLEQLRSSAVTLDGLGLRGEATWCMRRVVGVLKKMPGVVEEES